MLADFMRRKDAVLPVVPASAGREPVAVRTNVTAFPITPVRACTEAATVRRAACALAAVNAARLPPVERTKPAMREAAPVNADNEAAASVTEYCVAFGENSIAMWLTM